MGKHAYLILAHDNFDQLKTLIRCLDYKDNDIFVHINKLSKDFDEKDFEGICKKSNLFFTKRRRVHLGRYDLIQAELILFDAANKYCRTHYVQSYDFYHLLSGKDLPLYYQEIMHRFFDENLGKDFLGFNKDSKNIEKAINRASYYRFYYLEKIIGKKLNNVFLIVQRICGIDRIKKYPLEIYKGPQWCSITNESVEYLLERQELIKRHFRWTLFPDESYKQCILSMNPRNNYENLDGNVSSYLRYINWAAGGTHPKTFTIEDYDDIMNSGALFARKFDEKVDNEIIIKIANNVII